MGDATVSFLLEKLWEIGQSYVTLLAEDKKVLNELEGDLRLLKAFLQDAAKKPNKEKFYEETERQIRELVYDAEDTIDTRLTEVAVASKKKKLMDRFSRHRKSGITLAQEVRAVRDRMKPMLETARSFAGTEGGEGSAKQGEGQWAGAVRQVDSIREDNIVGFEDEELLINEFLEQQTKKLDVMSIIGMPGLGKSTLAWKIYKEKKTSYKLPIRIWVCVSEAFSRKDVFLKILRKFTGQVLSDLDENDLREEVRRHHKDSTFLLVLDDVWTEEAWEAIKVVLPMDNFQSKVIITTRYENVGVKANMPHNLRFLTKEESWKLLQLEVFGSEGACPDDDLERIGKSVAKKCDGLPLALVVLGGILRGQYLTNRPNDAIIEDWNDVDANMNMYFLRDKNAKGISDIVEWSYNILPDKLRDCFLYLGVFPEDYIISASMLTNLWLAEGFIQPIQGLTLEETAAEYLKDLVERNLVMVEEKNPNGRLKTCRVHDVIRAFCITRSTIEKQNLFQEMRLSKNDFLPPVSDVRKFRRLCIYSDLPTFLAKDPKGPHVRSLLCFNTPFEAHPSDAASICDAFKMLRVLESRSIKFRRFPDLFLKLTHLRYITLYIYNLEALLPPEISSLCNLETLLVETNSGTLEVQANIWTMNKLRILQTNAAIVLSKNEEGEGGENLQKLGRLSPECTERVLNKAKKLKRLGVRGKLDNLFKIKTLRSSNVSLEKLELVNDFHSGSQSLQLELPKADWFPRFLKRLTISATLLDWKQMSALGQIDTLKILKLEANAFSGRDWKVCHGFENLYFLLIIDADLVNWIGSDGIFPKLNTLVLKNCRNLENIPLNLAKSLHKLDIENLYRSAVASAIKIKEEKNLRPGATIGGGFKLNIGPGCEKVE